MILTVLLVLSLIVIGLLSYVVFRLSSRLLEFDELFDLFSHDIETNLRAFEKMKTSALLENSDEVFQAHKNMQIMAARLEEYLLRMESLVNRKLIKRPENLGPPPVVK